MDKFRPHGISALGKGFLQMAVSGHPAGQDNLFQACGWMASWLFFTSTSTMACWKEAATSSRRKPLFRCSSVWMWLITALFRPLKLKS